jgi:hypothetical protein
MILRVKNNRVTAGQRVGAKRRLMTGSAQQSRREWIAWSLMLLAMTVISLKGFQC